MRNLIIRRNKAFFGRKEPYCVYVSDPASGDFNINSTPCRLLGRIANGELAAFSIAEDAVQLFIVPENYSDEYCCEYCILPAGDQPITLHGKCFADKKNGHPFHFFGNKLPGKVKARRIIAGVLAGAIAIGAFFAFGDKPSFSMQQTQEKTFAYQGMEITLTEDFKEEDVSEYGFNTGYSSSDTAIYVLKEEFSSADGFQDLSLDEYAQLVISNNMFFGSAYPTHEDGLTIYEYEEFNMADGQNYYYMIAFFKGPDAFWMVEFSTYDYLSAYMRQTYLDYANTVTFWTNTI